MSPHPHKDNGLEWVQKTFDLEPTWTRDITPESIRQAMAKATSKNPHHLAYLTKGAFNKIYTLDIDGTRQILRISLPVDPVCKTSSEVATMSWAAACTGLPIPKVLVYRDQQDDPIGFEWILMTRIPGQTLSSAWPSIHMNAKFRIVHHLATAASKLFRHQLQGIGNIYPDHQGGLQNRHSHPKVDRIVSMEFFWGHRRQYKVQRGPFKSSSAWIAARLSLMEQECKYKLASTDDEDDIEDANRTLNIVTRLSEVSSLVFGSGEGQPEPTMLHHDDLNLHNIMVDNEGHLTGVLDWECVSALPLWKACYYPEFLIGPERSSRPEENKYTRGSNGEPGNLFKEHYKEYELTLLRRRFLDEMSSLEPNWVRVLQASQLQRDFNLALSSCDSEFVARHINRWIDAVMAREAPIFNLYDEINQ